MKKKSSLQTQTLIILLVFISFILGMIYFIQTGFLETFYRSEKINTIKDAAKKIDTDLVSDGDLDRDLDFYLLTNELCVSIISNDDSLNDFNRNNGCPLRRLDNMTINQLAAEVIDNGGDKLFENYRFRSGPEDVGNIYIYGLMSSISNNPALILVSTMVTPLSATINTIRQQFAWIIVVVVLATIVLSISLSRIVIRPINEITTESKNLSKGEYKANKVTVNNKEIEELNNTLIVANQDIQKADIAMKELLGNVSHDLRTPLTMIVGYGEMIRDLPGENNEDNANVIIDEAKRLSTLVDDLIDVSKSETGGVILHKRPVSMNSLLEAVYHQYKKYCDEKNIKFELKLLEDFTAELDENRIKQVLYNFMNNALNYNEKENAVIEIGVKMNNSKHRIYVYDNGQGIKEESLDKIWDRYYKVDKEHKRSHLGSGIGLALARNLLELHGFEYGVESKEGEYTLFYFDI